MLEANLLSLHERRESMCKKLFNQMQSKNHRLNKLLPSEKRINYGLRKVNKYETVRCRTKRYQNSFIYTV